MEAALKFTLTEYERDSVNWTGHDIIYKIKYLNLAVSLIIKKNSLAQNLAFLQSETSCTWSWLASISIR